MLHSGRKIIPLYIENGLTKAGKNYIIKFVKKMHKCVKLFSGGRHNGLYYWTEDY